MDVEYYALLIANGKTEEAEKYRLECNQEEWDALGDSEEKI